MVNVVRACTSTNTSRCFGGSQAEEKSICMWSLLMRGQCCMQAAVTCVAGSAN